VPSTGDPVKDALRSLEVDPSDDLIGSFITQKKQEITPSSDKLDHFYDI